MDEVLVIVISRINYWIYILLMMIGLYGIIVKKNFLKKVIGMSILQTSIILYFISIGAKNNATIPIIGHTQDSGHNAIQAAGFVNPLPHVLMLTAIVVAVATLGVALSLAIKIHKEYETLEEDDILAQYRNDELMKIED
jgi:multicomponent Na+:H+ antiporter subunit C